MTETAQPAAPRPAAVRAVLGQNQYGKSEVRVLKVTREGAGHRIRDLNVSVALQGDLDEVHYSGSNAHVLPTDTTKNTVYAFAKEHGVASPEEFGTLLARHFVATCAPITRARIRVEEYAWSRIDAAGGVSEDDAGTGHSFVRSGRCVRTAQVTHDARGTEVLSGVKGLTVLNSTDSEFHGYVKDGYTTLVEEYDRILATDVTAWWRHLGAAAPEDGWNAAHAEVERRLLAAFAGTYSYSLQQTLYEMGADVLEGRPELGEIRLSMPNKHHFRVDLSPFGLSNEPADGAVYYAADRPYGLIEATVVREGEAERIPVDLSNL
ncbi:factor-independent urate hydroxylase [Streptomyces xiaopingdaonensis]|uniref:factor-independent urate hydroxylase n=1 Tax=Streptomyces xiaopingdaonensis TaxID=1565415 RepID=UPI0003146B9D|nr:urate oxidase [Streptomyces xiaopingdaonensis]